MPGWVKVLLTVVTVIILLVVGVIVAGGFWWMRNKEALTARKKEIVTEGKDFGKSTDNQGCVDEAFSRYKKEPGFFSALANQGFLKGCLEMSSPTPGFCDSIPLGSPKMSEWIAAQCRRYEVESQRDCQGLLTSVAMFCAEKNRRQS